MWVHLSIQYIFVECPLHVSPVLAQGVAIKIGKAHVLQTISVNGGRHIQTNKSTSNLIVSAKEKNKAE